MDAIHVTNVTSTAVSVRLYQDNIQCLHAINAQSQVFSALQQQDLSQHTLLIRQPAPRNEHVSLHMIPLPRHTHRSYDWSVSQDRRMRSSSKISIAPIRICLAIYLEVYGTLLARLGNSPVQYWLTDICQH